MVRLSWQVSWLRMCEYGICIGIFGGEFRTVLFGSRIPGQISVFVIPAVRIPEKNARIVISGVGIPGEISVL